MKVCITYGLVAGLSISATSQGRSGGAVASKYRSVKTEVDGVIFASRREAARYGELKMLERIGYISGLTLQPKFPMIVNGQKICVYIADYAYTEKDSKRLVVEDVKGIRTAVYSIKKKLFAALYPMLRITEI